MQKIATLALLGLASALGARAQTPLTKGKGLLTGSINYHRESYDSNNAVDEFNFSPAAGVFVADNLVLGLSGSLQLGNYRYSGYNVPTVPAQSVAIGPFVRYYRFVGGDKFALFGQGSLGYQHLKSDNYVYSVTANQGYASITPGLAFFPVPRFGIEASLQGLSYATNFNNTSSLDLGFGLRDFQLGAAYYFGK